MARVDLAHAVGFVAGTDNDTTNLSLVAAARRINPALFVAARQNLQASAPLFAAMKVDSLLVPTEVVAHEVYAQLSTPLLWRFLQEMPAKGDAWADQLLKRISHNCGRYLNELWKIRLNPAEAPTLGSWLATGEARLGDLLRDPDDRESRLAVVPLLVQRDTECMLTPDDDFVLQSGDEILLAGRSAERRSLGTTLFDEAASQYAIHDRHVASSWIWRKLARQRAEPAQPLPNRNRRLANAAALRRRATGIDTAPAGTGVADVVGVTDPIAWQAWLERPPLLRAPTHDPGAVLLHARVPDPRPGEPRPVGPAPGAPARQEHRSQEERRRGRNDPERRQQVDRAQAQPARVRTVADRHRDQGHRPRTEAAVAARRTLARRDGPRARPRRRRHQGHRSGASPGRHRLRADRARRGVRDRHLARRRPVRSAASPTTRSGSGSARWPVIFPIALVVIAVVLMRKEPDPEQRPRRIAGGVAVTLSIAGILHVLHVNGLAGRHGRHRRLSG